MSDYRMTARIVQDKLSEDTEWKSRYNNYIEKLDDLAKKGDFIGAQERFSVPAMFQLYMPLSTVINECSSRRTVFELRFYGQSVAKVIVPTKENEAVRFRVKRTPEIYKAMLALNMAQEQNFLESLVKDTVRDCEYDWRSDEGTAFRKIYAGLNEKLKTTGAENYLGQPEHAMESFLLQNYSRKSAKQKEVSHIQPVVMCGTRARFQMPTPIKASDVKKGLKNIKNSGRYGGGIDILARIGSGRGTTLSVLELKDENIAGEPPEKAICQAVAYATFLRELLRSDSGQSWWEFFGLGGKIPNALRINAIIVMPNEPGVCTDFADEQVSFDGSDDIIQLGYIYRENPKKGLPQITSL